MAETYTLGDLTHQIRLMRGAHISTNISQEAVAYIVNHNPMLLFTEKFTILRVRNISQFYDSVNNEQSNVLYKFIIGNNGYVVFGDNATCGQMKILAERSADDELITVKTNDSGFVNTSANFEGEEYDISELIDAPVYSGQELLGSWFNVNGTIVWVYYPGFKFTNNTSIAAVTKADGVQAVIITRDYSRPTLTYLAVVKRANNEETTHQLNIVGNSVVLARMLRVQTISETTDLGKSGMANPPSGYGGAAYNGAFVLYDLAAGSWSVNPGSSWSSGTRNLFTGAIAINTYTANGRQVSPPLSQGINQSQDNQFFFGIPYDDSVVSMAKNFAAVKLAANCAELNSQNTSVTVTKKTTSGASAYADKFGYISDSTLLSSGFSLSIPSNASVDVMTVSQILDANGNVTGKGLYRNQTNKTLAIPAQGVSVCALILQIRLTNNNPATITLS